MSFEAIVLELKKVGKHSFPRPLFDFFMAYERTCGGGEYGVHGGWVRKKILQLASPHSDFTFSDSDIDIWVAQPLSIEFIREFNIKIIKPCFSYRVTLNDRPYEIVVKPLHESDHDRDTSISSVVISLFWATQNKIINEEHIKTLLEKDEIFAMSPLDNFFGQKEKDPARKHYLRKRVIRFLRDICQAQAALGKPVHFPNDLLAEMSTALLDCDFNYSIFSLKLTEPLFSGLKTGCGYGKMYFEFCEKIRVGNGTLVDKIFPFKPDREKVVNILDKMDKDKTGEKTKREWLAELLWLSFIKRPTEEFYRNIRLVWNQRGVEALRICFDVRSRTEQDRELFIIPSLPPKMGTVGLEWKDFDPHTSVWEGKSRKLLATQGSFQCAVSQEKPLEPLRRAVVAAPSVVSPKAVMFKKMPRLARVPSKKNKRTLLKPEAYDHNEREVLELINMAKKMGSNMGMSLFITSILAIIAANFVESRDQMPSPVSLGLISTGVFLYLTFFAKSPWESLVEPARAPSNALRKP